MGKQVSSARPKIADYPFTTLVPNLGVVELDFRSAVWCDIPGLLEGAHTGAGLGHEFLRHCQRCRCGRGVLAPLSPQTSPRPPPRTQQHADDEGAEREVCKVGSGGPVEEQAAVRFRTAAHPPWHTRRRCSPGRRSRCRSTPMLPGLPGASSACWQL